MTRVIIKITLHCVHALLQMTKVTYEKNVADELTFPPTIELEIVELK